MTSGSTGIRREARWRAGVVVLVVFVASTFGAAQQGDSPSEASNTGTIAGLVSGPGEVPVPGATVTLTETTTGERKQTWTDETGNFTFAGVQPGVYKLE